MDFRRLVADTMSVKSLSNASPYEALLGCGLLHCDALPSDELKRSLEAASASLGGDAVVGCFLEYTPEDSVAPVAAVVSYCEEGRLVVERAPVRVLASTLFCKGKEMALREGSSALFRVPCWLARSVFGITERKPVPILAHEACHNLGLEETLGTIAIKRPITMENALRQLDLTVWAAIALASPSSVDLMTLSIVDVLHCYGIVYIGSVHEESSDGEVRALSAVVSDDTTLAYWIEDYTMFDTDAYSLIIRFQGSRKASETAFYVRKTLTLSPDGRHLIEKKQQSTSPSLDVSEEAPPSSGLASFSRWVESLLPPQFDRQALPYMRQEVVGGFLRAVHGPTKGLPVRPFLINSQKADPSPIYGEHAFPPRLLYSPDLFLRRTRVPVGTKPCAVHFEVHIKPWIQDPAFQLFVRMRADRDHIYKIAFVRDGGMLPELGQLRTFVKSAVPDRLEKHSLNICVMRQTRRPDEDTEIIEFTITTHYQSFSICTNSLLCNFTIKATLFPYDAAASPRALPQVTVPVFSAYTQEMQTAHGGTTYDNIERVIRASKRGGGHKIYTSLYEAIGTPGEYSFYYWDGNAFVEN